MQYYFVTKKDNQFQLSKEDFHHIKNVMRLKEKDQFVCIYDKKNYLCTIHYVKDSYFIEVLQEILTTKELPLSIELYQAVIKNDKMDWVIQKATEIGVSAIIPLVTKRCVVKVETAKQDAKLVRYQKIIKEACEHSVCSCLRTLSSFTYLDDLVL